MNVIQVVAIIWIACLLCTIGDFVGSRLTEHNMQVEAINHHAAHWEVKPDGTTAFKWNDER